MFAKTEPAVVLWPGFERSVVSASEVVGVSLAGVSIGDGQDRAGEPPTISEVVSWDRVRVLSPELAAGRHDEFIGLARSIWRARTRLQRGDAVSAEPLFEAAFARLGGERGATSAVVAEGLLRCRLRRGVLASALPVWLTLLASDERSVQAADFEAGAYASRIDGLPPVLDVRTGIVPALPPIWVDSPAVAAFATAGVAESLVGVEPGSRAAVLASLYVASARLAVGLAFDDEAFASAELLAATDAGVRLCWSVAAAEHPDETVRGRALRALGDQLADIERRRARAGRDGSRSDDSDASDFDSREADRWTEAWLRTAIGLVLVKSPDPQTQRAGVLSLVHVPARFSDDASYLSGICLARAAEVARSLGNTDAAAVLDAEIGTRFYDHPLLSAGGPVFVPVKEDPGS
ncbi:MAG: hypothetical protein AAF297_12545 [Planctomycetota bacterium]